ncbi:2,5-diketo-D-gluconate reductase B [Halomicrobium zhouii]|uniref:2,5-diketo-D-gluconate reductase B n=1 Tax=Halomicrobium zhouii TaxID=767519 RepID=A0A1I6LI95_9EURY|nr:aldo/keto reductase [Halomicrobium zhouii]SFS03179.1 2,5-diketo-D-gluconate reductase B [Halomicrobium zhouii]
MTQLPPVGIGTWENTGPEECAESVRTALEIGYRHVDTAEAYGNEEHVGEGIARTGIDREEVFLATKVHHESTGLGYDDVTETARASLERLGVDYVDLLYVHWPLGNYDPEDTLSAFDDLVAEGVTRHVGVSNFEPRQVETAMDVLDEPLFANQVEMHPLLQQDDLVSHAQEHDYYLVAYSPLARGDVFDVPEVQDVAAKHGVSEAQVSLAWLRSKENVVAIPKATTEDHVADNWASQNLRLDEEDLTAIDGIEREDRHVEYDEAPWNR